MTSSKHDETYSEEETVARREATLARLLSTPDAGRKAQSKRPSKKGER